VLVLVFPASASILALIAILSKPSNTTMSNRFTLLHWLLAKCFNPMANLKPLTLSFVVLILPFGTVHSLMNGVGVDKD
jgi:hypothetical protein